MRGPIYLSEEIRRIERGAGIAEAELMERAATAAADAAVKIASETTKDVLVISTLQTSPGQMQFAELFDPEETA